MRWTCYLTKNREKPYRWLQAPYQKCTATFLWTSLPSFSKSTQREHSIITVEKGISIDQPKTLLPLSNHCFSQTSELDKRRCIRSEVVPESAFKYYCDLFNRRSSQNSGFDVFDLETWIFKYSLLMVTVPRYPKWRWLMGEGPFVAIIQRKRGLLGFKLFCFLTACSLLNPRGF